MKNQKLWRGVQIFLAVVLLASGLRLLLIYRERHQPLRSPSQTEQAPLDADAYVVPEKLHAYDLKSARELAGKTVIVYSGPLLFPAANKWKICCNENAKNLAWANQYPEFNHNEFIGWSKQPTDKPYAVIDLRSSQEHPRVQKRFEITARLLSGMRPAPHVVNAQGETLLTQLLYTITFGDFVSLYLALLNGLNPAPVDLVEKFKKEMAA